MPWEAADVGRRLALRAHESEDLPTAARCTPRGAGRGISGGRGLAKQGTRSPSARSRLRVEQYFPGQLDMVLGGALGGRKNPSLIRDLISGDVIRPS